MTAFAVMEGTRLGRKYPVTILVVDHDPTVLRLLRFLLVSAGYSVLEAHTDAEAIDQLTHSAQPIDLLLVDVELPGHGRNELARTSSSRRPRRHPLVSSLPTTSSRAGLWNAEVVHKPWGEHFGATDSELLRPGAAHFVRSRGRWRVGPAGGPAIDLGRMEAADRSGNRIPSPPGEAP